MKYNRTFILAVAAVASSRGDTEAEAVFNKLFDINTAPVARVVTKTPIELKAELNSKISGYVYLTYILAATRRVGKPWDASTGAVSWIEAMREESGLGLKDAKNTYDFVKANPSILDDYDLSGF
jgi:hypothetical protein